MSDQMFFLEAKSQCDQGLKQNRWKMELPPVAGSNRVRLSNPVLLTPFELLVAGWLISPEEWKCPPPFRT